MFQGFTVPIAALAALITGAFVWPEFFNIPSLLLTLGGAILVTYVSYPKEQLRGLLLHVRVLFMEAPSPLQNHIDELARLTRLFRLQGLRGLENQESQLKDPFLKQGVSMLVDLHKEETIHARMDFLCVNILSEHEASRQILLTLGKLLPSFGLIGTLIGMVLLLKNISGQDVQSLPAALGLAVLATLYGAVLANAVVAPLAARLLSIALEEERKMHLTLDWVTKLLRGEAAAAVAGKLRVSLPPIEAAVQERNWSPAVLPTLR